MGETEGQEYGNPKSPQVQEQEMKGCHFKPLRQGHPIPLSARMPRSCPDSALPPDAEIPMGISPPQAAPLTSLPSVLSTGSDTYGCAMNLHCTKPQKPQKPAATRLGGGGPPERPRLELRLPLPQLCVVLITWATLNLP